MKVSPKDMPKAIILLIAIGCFFIYIATTLLNHSKAQSAENTPAPNLLAGSPVRTAAVEPTAATPQQYAEEIEAWSRPPTAVAAGNPFRMVLSRDIMNSLAQQRNERGAMPPRQINGTGFGPGTGAFDPTQGNLPDVRIDFPDIKVQGVIVDTSTGSPTNFATILVDNAPHFAKAGDVIGNDLVVEKVTLQGVQIRAAKEHAFIEIDKSYKPNGMAPPAPPKAPSHRHSRRHS